MVSLSAIPSWVYKLLIVFATTIWGLSFVLMKQVVDVVPPCWLLGIRFFCAGLILLAVLFKRVAQHFSLRMVACGALLAVFDFLAFLAQTVGLLYTTPGINAFLTATYCVIVPFTWWIIGRKRPLSLNVVAAFIAVGGIWLVSTNGSSGAFALGLGEGLTLLCALLFAIHITLVSQLSKNLDVLVLTVFQFLFEGLFGMGLGACFETLPALATVDITIVGQMAFLIVFASVIAFGIQNVSLAYVPPAQASLFLSLESVFGVLFSVLLYGEVVTGQLLLGFALIFSAILVNEVVAPRFEAKRAIVSAKRDKWKEEQPHD